MGCCASKEPTRRTRRASRQAAPLEGEQAMRKHLNEVFDKYDLDRDDVLDAKEVRYMIIEMASSRKDKLISEKELQTYVRNFFEQVDLNKDGNIGREEFYHFYKQR
jgi:Ca2+-binding EF-hand superfamily protein